MAAGASKIGHPRQSEYVAGESFEGSGGKVVRGRHALSGREVVIRFGRADSKPALERFLSVAERAQRIRHPALTTIEAFGHEDVANCFLVSEYVEGTRLDRWTDQVGIPPLDTITALMAQLCSALAVLHANEIAHDALHPGNILVLAAPVSRHTNIVKLLDVGVPRFMGSPVLPLQAAHFMAPEQLEHALRDDELAPLGADARMNVYSIGCLLYYLCTGGPARASQSLESLLHAPHARLLVPASKINPLIPVQLDNLITRALSADPAERPRGMAELEADLIAIRLATGASGPQRAARAGDRVRWRADRQHGRRRRILGIAAVV